MNERKLTPKQTAFLKNPKGYASMWLEVSMNRAGASYSTTAIAMGMTRDALYKKANSELPNNNLTLAETGQVMLETEDITPLQELADLFEYELVPKGTMAKIKALPDAIGLPSDEEKFPMYPKQPRRPLLRAMIEEAAEK